MIRQSLAVKRLVGYTVTGLLVAVVGVVTGSANATILAALSGLLALGSISGTATLETVDQLERQATAVADGDLQQQVSSQRKDELGRLYVAIDQMRQSLATQIAELEETQTEAKRAQKQAEAAEQEATEMADAYRAVARDYAATMQQAADGDLTKRIDVSTEHEGMETIGTEFNAMMDDLTATLGLVESFASDIDRNVDTLADEGEAVEASVMQAVRKAEEITEESETQRLQLEDVTGEVNDLSATAQEVAATVDDLADKSQRVATTSENAQAASSDVIDEMSEIQAEMDRTVTLIDELAASTEEVTKITDIISEIADQTNILALNASIEAARAGQGGNNAGDGFAVVADEVKQLATETQERASEIAETVDEVRAQSLESADAIRSMSGRIKEGTSAVESTLNDLEAITTSVQEIDDGIAEIQHATADQAESTQTIAGRVDDILKVVSARPRSDSSRRNGQ
jgi:Methyl-accepting chemotaxis protein